MLSKSNLFNPHVTEQHLQYIHGVGTFVAYKLAQYGGSDHCLFFR